MRQFALLVCFFLNILTFVAAWDKEDYEIFDLVTALEAAEGKGTNFYSWLDIPSTATMAEIARAYRKKSVQIHPDKNPGRKDAHDRFSRLGVISKILRDKESRQRYDFFYKNGVPKWRGTGYYYSRFRPGLGTVLIFLTILSSGLQYLVQKLNYKRDLNRIEEIIAQAKSAAWGSSITPPKGQRKVKISLGGPSRYDEDGNPLPGRMVDMVVEGNDVYMLEPGGNLLPLNSSTAVPPSISRTWFLALVVNLYTKVVKRGSSSGTENLVDDESLEDTDDGSVTNSDAPGSGTSTPKEGNGGTALKASRSAATMAGGKRRKAVRKR
ncbi:DnaJ-domain-containing protein [Abortiporus biennis]|nr:DnaJ-domain-containing protein [Abortiporus biennis]